MEVGPKVCVDDAEKVLKPGKISINCEKKLMSDKDINLLSSVGANAEREFTKAKRKLKSGPSSHSGDLKPISKIEPSKGKTRNSKLKCKKESASSCSEIAELNVSKNKDGAILKSNSCEDALDDNKSVPKRMLSFNDVWVQKKFVSDFDLMLAARKTQRLKATKRKNTDAHELLNYNDTQIQSLLAEMKAAAAADRELRLKGFPATKKITMLPRAMSQLVKLDLHAAFLENGVLAVLSEWLTPILPDKSLPVLQIRESILKLLTVTFSNLDGHELKTSGLVKAVMELFNHPRETATNKLIEQKLLINWSRPMTQRGEPDAGTLTEEWAKREHGFIPMQKIKETAAVPDSRDLNAEITKARQEKQGSILPGEPNWVPRAVRPSLPTKAFVVRPKWNSNTDISKTSTKKLSRLEKLYRNFKRQKTLSNVTRAVSVSINGRNLMMN